MMSKLRHGGQTLVSLYPLALIMGLPLEESVPQGEATPPTGG